MAGQGGGYHLLPPAPPLSARGRAPYLHMLPCSVCMGGRSKGEGVGLNRGKEHPDAGALKTPARNGGNIQGVDWPLHDIAITNIVWHVLQ